MTIGENFHSALQGFATGAIITAYIADYNRNQLPIAAVCLILSIVLRMISKSRGDI